MGSLAQRYQLRLKCARQRDLRFIPVPAYKAKGKRAKDKNFYRDARSLERPGLDETPVNCPNTLNSNTRVHHAAWH